MNKDTAPLPDLEAMAELMERVGIAKQAMPQLAGLELDEVLRFVESKRAIFSGTYNGTPAVIRFYLDEPRAFAKRDWDELQRTWVYMSDGPYRVNEPLFHWPDMGLIIVRHNPGQPMLERIWQSEKEDRFRMMLDAVHWLRHYTRPAERRSAMRAGSWLSKAEKRMSKNASVRLRPLFQEVRAELHRLVPSMEGKDWRVTISHGDFHPNNLLVSETCLTGIDTGGSAKLPLYKDMARFLTHMGRRALHPSGASRFGVDQGTFDLFVDVFELDEPEREVWLPFMIGIEALLRPELQGINRSRLRRAQAFYTDLVSDLRQVRP